MVIATGERPQQSTTTAYEQERRNQREVAAERIAERQARRPPEPLLHGRGSHGRGPALLKKLINTADFVGIRYLEAGVAAARAIGRVTSATPADACRAARQRRQR